MNKEELFLKVRHLISDNIGIDEAEITLTSHFINDLGCDSLLLAELIMTVEDKFKVVIPDGDAEKLDTVGSIVDYIYNKK